MKNLKQEKQFFFWGLSYKTQSTKCPIIYESTQNKMYCKSKLFKPEKHVLTYDEAMKIFKSNYETYNCKVTGISFYPYGNYGILDLDNAFLDGTNTPRAFMKLLIDKAIEKKSCIFYSSSKLGLHIPFKVEIGLPYTANKLYNFTDKDIDTNILDSTGKPKEPGIDFYSNGGNHVALTWEPYADFENITLTDTDLQGLYNTFKSEKEEKKKGEGNNDNINKLIDTVSIDDVLLDYMSYVYPGKKDFCPFHNGHSESFERFEANSNKYICYSTECQTGIQIKQGTARLIDSLNVIQHAENCTTSQAIKSLEKTYMPFYSNYDLPFEPEKEDYLDEFQKHVIVNKYTPIISTGFKELDSMINGGLYSGLYTVGAISSLGKTAFTLQIADNIAKSGNKVLFFSLEMPGDELIARSISRLMFLKNPSKCINISTFNVLYGRTDYCKEEYKTAIEEYREIRKNLEVVQCDFGTDIKFIIDYVDNYIQRTNTRPVVIIDYLQIIKAVKTEKYVTEKEKVDSIVVDLKRLSNKKMPVIVISSFNRENYNSPVTYNSFKESGGIEYTSDIIIGLQLSVLDELKNAAETNKAKKAVMLHEAKGGDKLTGKREVTCVILKNRNGTSNTKCKLKFYAKNNLFTEVGV